MPRLGGLDQPVDSFAARGVVRPFVPERHAQIIHPASRAVLRRLPRQHRAVRLASIPLGERSPRDRFARLVGDQTTLDHLYLLTLADIAATSPKLWNSWKATLLADLYASTTAALTLGLDQPQQRERWVEDARRDARALLLDGGMDEALLKRTWAHLPDDYFLRVPAEQIAWQTSEMATADGLPLVAVRRETGRGATEVLIHAENLDGTFATIVSTLGRLELEVVDARVFNTADDRVVDAFQVLDRSGQMLDEARAGRIRRALAEALAVRPLEPPQPSPHLPRRLKHFVRPPQIEFSPSRDDPLTVLKLHCSDRPGLLGRIALVILEHDVRVHGARIATLGDRVEDYFILSDLDNRPLSDDAQEALRDTLARRLTEDMPADTPDPLDHRSDSEYQPT